VVVVGMEVCVWECEIERPHGGDMAMGSGPMHLQLKRKSRMRRERQINWAGEAVCDRIFLLNFPLAASSGLD